MEAGAVASNLSSHKVNASSPEKQANSEKSASDGADSSPCLSVQGAAEPAPGRRRWVRKNFDRTLDEADREQVVRIARDMGFEVKEYGGPAHENGQFDGRTIGINRNRGGAGLTFVIGHELNHGLDKLAPELTKAARLASPRRSAPQVASSALA